MKDIQFTLRDTASQMGWERNFLGEDWSVMRDGEVVGRIKTGSGQSVGGPAWFWSVTLPVADPGNGRAETLEDAKRQWRAAWNELVARVGQDAIDRAIAASRTARSRCEPWIAQHGPRPAKRQR